MERKSDRFGINMIKYCEMHEQYVQEHLEKGENLEKLFEYHNLKIKWLQHERLVHFLVTMLTAAVFLFVFGVTIFLKDSIVGVILSVILLLLLAAYLIHYFRLENTVQHWYRISDEIYRKINRD